MAAGLYLHIPFCRSRCDYCSFVSCCDTKLAEEYYQKVKEQAEKISYGGEFDTVYFGGGTPSAVPKLLEKLYGLCCRTFSISKNSEITVECNPDSVDDELISVLKKINCNRVSLGLQSTDDAILASVGRRHNFEQFAVAVQKIREVTTNISADIMLGLPMQTVESAVESVNLALDFGIKHISVYALKVEDGTPLKSRGYTVDEDMQADMYDAVYEAVQKRGFERYEVSNFSLPGYESKHNLKYWDLEDYVGLGAAAHSYYGGKRYEGVGLKEFLAGQETIAEDVSEEFDEELIMLSLRCSRGLELDRLKNKNKFLMEKKSKIDELKSKGLIEVKDGFLRLTKDAFYLMNSVIVKLI